MIAVGFNFAVVLSLCFADLSISTTSPGKSSSSHASFEKLAYSIQQRVRIESFLNWKEWKEKYPQCNPENNAYTSPIKIVTGSIVSASNMKRIFIHSKLPVDDCLSLSVLYKERDLEMQAVTLNALAECSQQLTYISGGGDKPISLRYFKRAVFFFTNTDPVEGQSLHQLKGKQFQMEILLEFMALNKKDITQVFILVEVKPPEATPANPVFTAIEPALVELHQVILNESSGKSKRSQKLKELEEACYNNEEKYLKADQETKDIFETDQLNKVQTIIRNIKGITNKDLEKLAGNHNSTLNVTNTSTLEVETLAELRKQRSNLIDIMREEKEEWALDKLQTVYKKLEYVIMKMDLHPNGNTAKFEKIKKILKENKVGVPGENSFEGMLYESPDAVNNDFLNIKRKIEEYIKSANLHKKSCQDFIKFKMEPYASVRIKEPFQISWLFPQTGGYYLYNGSNPLPECKRRDVTIVFEKSISISTDQLSCFQNLPSLIDFSQNGATSSNQTINQNIYDTKLDKMIPILSNVKTNRKVWHVAKNPMYLDDDGFHMKSSRARQEAATNQGKVTLLQNHYCHIVTTYLSIMIVPLTIWL